MQSINANGNERYVLDFGHEAIGFDVVVGGAGMDRRGVFGVRPEEWRNGGDGGDASVFERVSRDGADGAAGFGAVLRGVAGAHARVDAGGGRDAGVGR